MRFITSLLLLVSGLVATAQVTEFVSDLQAPTGIALKGTSLYFTDQNDSEGWISVVDISSTDPVPKTFVNGLQNPAGLIIDENTLYISDFGNTESVIYKVDLAATEPKLKKVVGELNGAFEMAIHGGFLYYSEVNAHKISKIELKKSKPKPTIVYESEDLYTHGLAVYNNYLYFTTSESGSADVYYLKKIKLSGSNPRVEDVLDNNCGYTRPLHIGVHGDELYLSDFVEDRVYSMDLTAANPKLKTILANVDGVRNFAEFNEMFFFMESHGKKITRVVFDPDHMEEYATPVPENNSNNSSTNTSKKTESQTEK